MTPIQPVLLGSSEAALEAQRELIAAGFCVVAIRPPTVPAGSSRLRLTVMASHTRSELRDAARTLAKCVSARRSSASEIELFDGLRNAA